MLEAEQHNRPQRLLRSQGSSDSCLMCQKEWAVLFRDSLCRGAFWTFPLLISGVMYMGGGGQILRLMYSSSAGFKDRHAACGPSSETLLTAKQSSICTAHASSLMVYDLYVCSCDSQINHGLAAARAGSSPYHSSGFP